MNNKIYAGIDIFLLIIFATIISSCDFHRDNIRITHALISEPLKNRDDNKLIHDRDCIGFHKQHFVPSIIKPAHFSGDGKLELQKTSKIKWNEYTKIDTLIDFKGSNKYENKVIYYAEVVEANEAAEVILAVGSDDGFELWLNGDSVYCKHKGRLLQINNDLIPLKLKKGNNVLLYKVDQGDGLWALYRRFYSKQNLSKVLDKLSSKIYNDLPESCIIKNSSEYLPLNKDPRMKLDSLHSLKFKWSKFDVEDKIFHVNEIVAADLPDSIKLPAAFNDIALLEVQVLDKDKKIKYIDKTPIIHYSAAVALAGQLLEKSDKNLNYPQYKKSVITARRNSVERLFAQELNIGGDEKQVYSTRMKAHALYDLYYACNSSEVLGENTFGPIIMGYQSKYDSLIQKYRVFIPPNFVPNGNKKCPTVFSLRVPLKTDEKFWEAHVNRSHFRMIERNRFSAAYQCIMIAPFGRGYKNYFGNALDELPAIFDQMTDLFLIERDNIHLFTVCGGAIPALKLLQKIRLPIKTVGFSRPAFPINNSKVRILLQNIKNIYPDLKWIIVHSPKDKKEPFYFSKIFVELLDEYDFSYTFIPLKDGGDPRETYYEIISKNYGK